MRQRLSSISISWNYEYTHTHHHLLDIQSLRPTHRSIIVHWNKAGLSVSNKATASFSFAYVYIYIYGIS